MKNIFVAAIFLFSQIGFSVEKVNQETARKFQIEDLTFSQLLLTKEEIIHLNEEDQAKYLFAMIALGQIIEGSQNFQMGYQDKVAIVENQKIKAESFSKYSAIFQAVVQEAQAFVFLARVAAAVAPVLMRAGSWVISVGERAIAKVGTTAASGAQMAFEFAPSKEVLKKMSVAVAEKAKNLRSAQEKAIAAMKKSPGSASQLKEEAAFAEARTAFAAEKEAFLKAGGSPEQFASAAKESGLKKILMWPFRNAKSLIVGGLAFHGADTIMLDRLGISVEKWAAGTALSGPGALTPEQLKAGDSKQEVRKPCLFGGVPSIWLQQGNEINCTRPADGSNANCKQEDGKFQCPSYGIKLASGSIDPSLCIDTVKTTNLTVRCASTLKVILEAKQVTLDSRDAALALKKNYGEVLAGLEARDRMKNEKGETKSIFEYCEAESVTQKQECGAIKEVLALLRTTDVMKLYETRQQQTAATPPAPADGAPAAAPVEGKQ